MKRLLPLLLFYCYLSINGQPFVEHPASDVLPNMHRGTVRWVDYDNDGDLDLFIAGKTKPNTANRIATLFRNSNGVFEEISGLPFFPFTDGDADWVDYDNDGDLDLMTVGIGGLAERGTRLYINNISNFTEVSGTPFINVGFFGGIAWADYDIDGDLDVVIAGNNSSGASVIALYRNDLGTFTEITDAFNDQMESIIGSAAIEWVDFDNDNDSDLIVVGFNNVILFENQNGDLNPVEGTPFATNTSHSSTLGVFDYDGDGDQDVIISGNFATKLYTNSEGTFTLSSELSESFPQLDQPAIGWADFDNDGDLDILFTGYGKSEGAEISKLYENINGEFSPLDFNFNAVQEGSVAWGDYDLDGDQDVVISGRGLFGLTLKLFENKLIDNPVTGLVEEPMTKIFPNPTHSILNIDCPDSYFGIISMTDMSGRILIKEELTGSRSINIEQFTPGVYLLSIIHNNSVQREKILKIN